MSYVRILGASGSKTKNAGTTSFQIAKDIIIDAGNIINTLGDFTEHINHIFISHSHADHITDLPFIVEGYFEKRKEPLTIYASKQTINSLKKHTFNDEIWPDFSKISLLGTSKKALVYKEIEVGSTTTIRDIEIKAIHAEHICGALGFVIIKAKKDGYLISGDTFLNDKIVEEINNDERIKILLIECSFPNRMEQLAKDSKHLNPNLLFEQLKNIKTKDLKIFVYHIKHIYYEQMQKELNELNIFENGGKILEEGDIIHLENAQVETDLINRTKFKRIMDINLELANELDKDKLLEMILSLTRDLTHSQAGTLYIKSEDKKFLEFKVVQNKPLNIKMGGTKEEINWPALPLYLEDGKENKTMVAVTSALEKKIVNIPDVYNTKEYDFEGTKKFDKQTGFKSKSMLVIPLRNHEDDVIGVIQLINKTKVSGRIVAYDEYDERVIKALASQAAMALTNSLLISSLESFLDAFVSTIASAIDAKSKHTLKHIEKVSKLAPLIARSIHEDNTLYKDVKYTKNDFKEIELAAKMHDIGKISMPESVIDKATKLQFMMDGIELVNERIEIIKRDCEILLLKNEISQEEYNAKITQINDDKAFLEKVNIGGEFMRDEDIQRIEEISKYTYVKNDQEVSLLTKEEKYNLSIQRGTLTKEEKDIMNSHAQLSYDMLNALPFPKKYENVMHIAVNHHEKLNGKGYPRGLNAEEIVLEDRIMILADVFEALTSNDRPYKSAKKLSEVFRILSFMAKDGEIDADLLKFFHESEALKQFCKEELDPEQLDESQLNI